MVFQKCPSHSSVGNLLPISTLRIKPQLLTQSGSKLILSPFVTILQPQPVHHPTNSPASFSTEGLSLLLSLGTLHGWLCSPFPRSSPSQTLSGPWNPVLFSFAIYHTLKQFYLVLLVYVYMCVWVYCLIFQTGCKLVKVRDLVMVASHRILKTRHSVWYLVDAQ